MGENSLNDSSGATLASSMQRFDASTMILTCPAQRSQVSMGPPPDRSECGPIKYTLEPLHPGHRRVALSGRLVQPIIPSGLTLLATPAHPRGSDTHTKLAIGMVRQSNEHPVKARQIDSWLCAIVYWARVVFVHGNPVPG
jgi:hypothetical protein